MIFKENLTEILDGIRPFLLPLNSYILKTLREKNKNTVGAIQNPCGSDSKTLRERESAPSVF